MRRRAAHIGAAVACGITLAVGAPGSAQAQDLPPAPETPDLAATAAEVQGLLADVQGDPANAVAIARAYVDGKLGEATSQGLTTALSLLTRITKPVCPTTGTVSSLLPLKLNLNYSPLSPLGALDKTTSEALYQNYKTLFTTLVTPLTLPSELAAGQSYVSLAQALLALLKVEWVSTYRPPGGGAPVVRRTPALLNLPMILDVDGQVGPGGYELCATMTLDTATGNIAQQVTRMPLSRSTLPVDVRSEFLGGLVAPGYEASNAPYAYDTALGLAGSPVNTKVSQAGASLTQTLNLTSALQFRYASTAPIPASYAFASTHPGKDASQPSSQQAKGNKVTYTASARGGSFDYTLDLAGLKLGVGATPSPTSLQWCTSTKGYCSNEPGADPELATTSTHLAASQPVRLDQHALSSVPGTCTAFASPATDSTQLGDSQLVGQRLFLSARTGANGEAWVDTDGLPVSGCLATSSTTGTLPDGFSANDRKATWGAGLVPAPLTKTGTIICPGGTALTGGTLGLTFGLSRYLCVFSPQNTALPVISGTGATRTSSTGTWTPSGITNPNTPTFTRQWLRCDAGGGACAPIAGATGTSYALVPEDSGGTLRVEVTATNFDGTAKATSNPTAVP